MKKFLTIALAFVALVVNAQEPVVLNGFWDNWYLQAGLDMSLQKPYKYDFSKVFPNGKSFGVDLALGKWYTPVLGLRAKLNWENGIGLFRNNHANWLAPFDQPGVNMDRGGYICGFGDVQLDLHNLFCGYEPDRMWNAQAFLRAGGTYNFGVSKGSPLVGVGIGSTFRFNDKLSIYVDGAYNAVSSGHVGVAAPTGTGSGANAFFDFNVGVQYNLGKSGWEMAQASQEGVTTDGFWRNWFVEAGLDMSLQCPYGKDFSEVFPKGKTFGVNVGVGKQFSPFIAVRAHFNWENGIGLFRNGHLEWLSTGKDGKSNMDCGGYIVVSADVPVSVSNIVMGYDEHRNWDGYVYARAGIISNRATESASPLVGGGIGYSHRIADRIEGFGEFGMQATTSEFYQGVAGTGMSVATGFNCFFDIACGVRWRIR